MCISYRYFQLAGSAIYRLAAAPHGEQVEYYATPLERWVRSNIRTADDFMRRGTGMARELTSAEVP